MCWRPELENSGRLPSKLHADVPYPVKIRSPGADHWPVTTCMLAEAQEAVAEPLAPAPESPRPDDVYATRRTGNRGVPLRHDRDYEPGWDDWDVDLDAV